MSASNHTTNYNLPQFTATDKPAWQTDINGAFSTIDAQMASNASAASSAEAEAVIAAADATSALSNAQTAQTTANAAQTAADTADGKAVAAQNTANSATQLANGALGNIGTLSNLTTSDKSDLVAAVNEVNAKPLPQVLYTGNLSAGTGLSVSVPNLSQYKLIAVNTTYSAYSPILLFKISAGYSGAGCSYGSGGAVPSEIAMDTTGDVITGLTFTGSIASITSVMGIL